MRGDGGKGAGGMLIRFQQCGIICRPRSAAMSQTLAVSVRPPTRPTSGWAMSTSPVHQVGEFVSGGLPFAGGDANAAFVVHPCVAVEVVHPERGFEKVDVEFCPVTDGGERPVGAALRTGRRP